LAPYVTLTLTLWTTGGAFGRTALAAESGAKTPFYNLTIGVIVIVVLVAATDLIYYVPKATLAAIIQVRWEREGEKEGRELGGGGEGGWRWG